MGGGYLIYVDYHFLDHGGVLRVILTRLTNAA